MSRPTLLALLSCSLSLACAKSSGDGDGGASTSSGESGAEATGESGGCAGTLTPCGDACADLEHDDQNCGACGNACGAMFECYDASCHHRCEEGGGDYCAGACVYTESDDEHCGGCDNACGPGFSCELSECVPEQDPACMEPSDTAPPGDPQGPYGSCAGPMDCVQANTCMSACGGVCAPDCDTVDDCPAIDGYAALCVEDDFGVGTCRLACETVDDCPGGMACSEMSCTWPG
jgi:hypothetical protein